MHSDQLVDKLVGEQLSAWLGGIVNYQERLERFWNEVRHHPAMHRLSIQADRVTMAAKGLQSRSEPDPYYLRAETYCCLLSLAVASKDIAPLSIIIDTGDEAQDVNTFPVFTFQKVRGARNILLPDVEMVTSNFFENIERDSLPFEEKLCVASFAGSTTGGGLIDEGVLARNTMPRLRAARFFRTQPAVDFRLSRLVQCASPEIVASLEAEGFGGEWIDWPQAYLHKFGISVDGNGAACSRPAVLLLSNCALIKYESNNTLYYFSALQPGTHYISVEKDEDVLSVLERERVEPGYYREVACAAKDFAVKILNRDCVLHYTSELLFAFSKLSAMRLT